MKRVVLAVLVVGAAFWGLVSCQQPATGTSPDTSNLIDPTGLYVESTADWNAGGAVWWGKSDGKLYSRIQTSNWDSGASFPQLRAIESLDPNDTRGAFLEVSRQYGDGHFNFILLGTDNSFGTGDTVKVTFDIKADFVADDSCWLQVYANDGGDWTPTSAYYAQRMDYGVYGDGNMHTETVPAQDASGVDLVPAANQATWMFKWDSTGTAPIQEVPGTTNGQYKATAFYDGTTTNGWKTVSIILPPTFIGYVDTNSNSAYDAGVDTLESTNNGAVTLGITFASLAPNVKKFYLDNLKVEKLTSGSYSAITAVQ